MSTEDIKFACPHCKQSLEAPADMEGETIPCPKCNTNIVIKPQSAHIFTPSPTATAPSSSPSASGATNTPQQGKKPLKRFVTKAASNTSLQTEHTPRASSEEVTQAVVPTPSSDSVDNSPISSHSSKHHFSKKSLLGIAVSVIVLFVIIGIIGYFLYGNEETRLSRIHATVKGGAWLTKKNGNSDMLRGLEVTLFRAKVSNKFILAFLKVKLARLEAETEAAKTKTVEWEKRVKEKPDDVCVQEDYSDWKHLSISKSANAEDIKRVLSEISSRDSTAATALDFSALFRDLQNMTTDDALVVGRTPDKASAEAAQKRLLFNQKNRIGGAQQNGLISEMQRSLDRETHNMIYQTYNYVKLDTSEANRLLAELLTQQYVSSIKTGIDGTYELNATGGDFCLYAEFDSSYNHVRWFIPLVIKKSGIVKVDLDNSNAFEITNKDK